MPKIHTVYFTYYLILGFSFDKSEIFIKLTLPELIISYSFIK